MWRRLRRLVTSPGYVTGDVTWIRHCLRNWLRPWLRHLARWLDSSGDGAFRYHYVRSHSLPPCSTTPGACDAINVFTLAPPWVVAPACQPLSRSIRRRLAAAAPVLCSLYICIRHSSPPLACSLQPTPYICYRYRTCPGRTYGCVFASAALAPLLALAKTLTVCARPRCRRAATLLRCGARRRDPLSPFSYMYL